MSCLFTSSLLPYFLSWCWHKSYCCICHRVLFSTLFVITTLSFFPPTLYVVVTVSFFYFFYHGKSVLLSSCWCVTWYHKAKQYHAIQETKICKCGISDPVFLSSFRHSNVVTMSNASDGQQLLGPDDEWAAKEAVSERVVEALIQFTGTRRACRQQEWSRNQKLRTDVTFSSLKLHNVRRFIISSPSLRLNETEANRLKLH